MTYMIDNNVPMPSSRRNYTGLTNVLCQLNPGQSVLVPNKTSGTVQATVQYAKRKSAKNYSLRTEENGIRVWCVPNAS